MSVTFLLLVCIGFLVLSAVAAGVYFYLRDREK